MTTLIAQTSQGKKVQVAAAPEAHEARKEAPTYSPEFLDELVHRVGISRFVSRINAGFIQPDAGFAAVERSIHQEKQRPMLGLLGNFFWDGAIRIVGRMRNSSVSAPESLHLLQANDASEVPF